MALVTWESAPPSLAPAPQAFPLRPSVAEIFDFAAAVRCLVLEGGGGAAG